VGCSLAPLDTKQTKIALIKSPKLKFQDIAYIQHNKDNIELELYSAGVAVGKIAIGYMVCTNEGCITKERFNQEFFGVNYPKDTLENILRAQPIFNGKNLQKKGTGFVQHIRGEGYDIIYKVSSFQTFFKDRKNHIIIKLKDLK